MNKTSPIYDNTIQKQLDALICGLDENPHVCTDPVDDSSYMGFTLADTEEVFLKHVKVHLFDTFIEYIESYKKECINTYATKTHFIPVIKRLLAQYESDVNALYDSEIRNQWSQYVNESTILDKEQNLKKQAYQFFLKAAGVQIFFLGKLVDKMKDYLAEFKFALPKPEPEYYFSILPEFTTQRHYILYDIHKNLKAKGYVDCTDDAFKRVFTTKEPKPIRWLKPQRSLLYLIKRLSGRFLVEKDKPSNYYIGERYFHIYKNGKLFPPKKIRYDKDPSPKVAEFINKIIDDAISAYC
jgi:hypothetical protein